MIPDSLVDLSLSQLQAQRTMVQGGKKLSGGRPGALKKENSAKQKRFLANAQKVKKGNALQLPKKHFVAEALENRDITKAIGKSIEQKLAAKVIQNGGHIGLRDVMQKGKELSKELRRKEVKKRKTRVELKLEELKALATKESV